MQQCTCRLDGINQTNDLANEGICHIRITGSPGANLILIHSYI